MKLGTVVICLALVVGLILVIATPVLANGGEEASQALSYNPLVLGVVGVAVLVVAYLMYRILRGR